MKKCIMDERTRIKYQLVGDYYVIAGDDESEVLDYIGIWGSSTYGISSTTEKCYTSIC